MTVRTRSPIALRFAGAATASLFIQLAHAAVPCNSLVGVSFPGALVTAATDVTPPMTFTGPGGTGTVTVPFCRVQGIATAGPPDSQITFEVWLPPDNAWTGRTKTEATGGYLGGVAYARMAN